MPSLGVDMEAGTLVQWLVKPGDPIKRGDIIAVVETDKGAIEIEVFQSGILQSLVVQEGEKVPIGITMALIAADGEAAGPAPLPSQLVTALPAPPPRPAAPPPPPPSRPAIPPAAAPPPPARRVGEPALAAVGRLRISPLAMRVALELGVNPAALKGTGPGGAITRSDVERTAKAKAGHTVAPPAPAPTAPPPSGGVKAAKPAVMPTDKQAAMRRAIAAAMAHSKREIPHYYLGTQIDMSRAMAWLQAENLKRSVSERLLYSVMLLKAVALALREFPELNGFWMDGAFKPGEGIHVGVAISLRLAGLVAPAIHDLDKMSLSEIMVSMRDLVKRVRAGVLRSSEIADATITVTSLGEQGVETVFGVIYPPQVALVGFGKIVERVWAEGGMVGARPVIIASLSGDHRASDGHRGGLFLAAIDRLLQEPEKL
jgi:pyruvate dehydrogenase E2 component (dihydrolipoamide acetyltransferase)